jgi:hypothetical protein
MAVGSVSPAAYCISANPGSKTVSAESDRIEANKNPSVAIKSRNEKPFTAGLRRYDFEIFEDMLRKRGGAREISNQREDWSIQISRRSERDRSQGQQRCQLASFSCGFQAVVKSTNHRPAIPPSDMLLFPEG